MSYWVYEDDPTNRVRVHQAKCRWCNDGKGTKGSRLADSRWQGPFNTEREAVEKALYCGRRDAAGCGSCLPVLGKLR